MKKVKTGVATFLIDKVLERAAELNVTVCCSTDDLDHADLVLFGDNATLLRKEIEQGLINIKTQG